MAEDNRPSWDEYFMKMANDVATRTTCLRRGVGAVIVKDRRILATGYNGVQDAGEVGLANQTIYLTQWFWVSAGAWVEFAKTYPAMAATVDENVKKVETEIDGVVSEVWSTDEVVAPAEGYWVRNTAFGADTYTSNKYSRAADEAIAPIIYDGNAAAATPLEAVDGVDEWYQKELEGQGYDDAKELIETFTK